MSNSVSIYNQYLKILNVPAQKPGLTELRRIVRAHLMRIPFENISKIYYRLKHRLEFIPDIELYLKGIEQYHFGGTCYSNNYYLNGLLRYLGYDVSLCGADMNQPDVHIINIVTLDQRDFLVDVGYAAPFYEPIPLDLHTDQHIILGGTKYLITPRDKQGKTRVSMYRNRQDIHGYTIKPQARKFSEFAAVIKHSFRASATFFNALLLVRFDLNESITIHNYSLTKARGTSTKITRLYDDAELIEQITTCFNIPRRIVTLALHYIDYFRDAWA